jgi:hypothetical protein
MKKRLAKLAMRVSTRPGSGFAVRLKRITAIPISTATTTIVHRILCRILSLPVILAAPALL